MLSHQNFGPVMQGDTYRVEFALQGSDGAPLLLVDLTGATVLWYWSKQPGGVWLGDPIAATLVDGGSGAAMAQVDIPTDSVGSFYYEFEMTLSGDISTMATGSFQIIRQMVEATP